MIINKMFEHAIELSKFSSILSTSKDNSDIIRNMLEIIHQIQGGLEDSILIKIPYFNVIFESFDQKELSEIEKTAFSVIDRFVKEITSSLDYSFRSLDKNGITIDVNNKHVLELLKTLKNYLENFTIKKIEDIQLTAVKIEHLLYKRLLLKNSADYITEIVVSIIRYLKKGNK